MIAGDGTTSNRAPRPDPCGRQAPALQDSGPISRYGACVRSRELGGLWREPWRLNVREQLLGFVGEPTVLEGVPSLIRATAGSPRYEKPELWLGTANWHGGFCHAPPRPLRGTSPRATFSHSAIGHRSTIRHVSPVESRHRGRLEGTSRIGVRDMLSYQ